MFTGDGYWTPTSEEAICIDGQVDGYKKEFIYYCGTEHPGNRTNWYIHQFRLNPDVYGASAVGNNVDYKVINFRLCKKLFTSSYCYEYVHYHFVISNLL